MDCIRTHKTEATLFLVSCIVHLAASVFLFAKFHDNVLYFENEDAHGYVKLAKMVVTGHGFSRDGIHPSAIRTPAWPLVLSGIMETRLPFTWTVMFLQNIFASLSAVLLYAIGVQWFSRRTGLIAGYLYALEPYMLMTANLATTEIFFNFLVISFLYYFARTLQQSEKKSPCLFSAALLGFATLTRPVTLYAPMIVLIIYIVQCIRKKISLKQCGVQSIVWLAIFTVVIAPWSIRDYIHYHTFRITNIDANMMYYRIAPIVVSEQEQEGYAAAISTLHERISAHFPHYDSEHVNNDFLYYEYMTRETRQLVQSRPLAVAKFYAVSLIPALTGTGYEYMLETIFGVVRQGVRANYTALLLSRNFSGYLAALATVDVLQATLLLGAGAWVAVYMLILWTLCRKQSWRDHSAILLTLLLFAGYFIFFSLGPQVHARYRMPTLPFLYLLFAYSIDSIFSRSKPSINLKVSKS